MALIVLGFALNVSVAEARYLLAHPALLTRSLLAMNLVMPLLAAAAVVLLNLDPATEIGLIALALSPIPPILPTELIKAGGSRLYTAGLLSVATAGAFIVVPAGIALLGWATGSHLTVSVTAIAPPVLVTVLVPLAIGLLSHHLAPDFAERVAAWVSVAGVILLVAGLVPAVVATSPLLVAALGNGTALALAAFALVGLAVGHQLGGPEPDDRTVLALATAARHPGVALAVAGATFPEATGILAVVLWHLVIGAIVTAPYISWRRRVHVERVRRSDRADYPTF
jgi:BASS family bile acid:Na+ symporter